MSLFQIFLVNGVWHLPRDLPSDIHNEIIQIQPLKSSSNVCIWLPSIDGKYLCKHFLAAHSQPVAWAKFIWKEFLPPSRSLLVWLAYLGYLPTEDNLVKKGFNLASRCSLCHATLETIEHIFIHCSFAR